MHPGVRHTLLNPGFDIDALRAMNAMSGISGRDKRAIDFMVKRYKQFGLWAKTDMLHLHALSQPLAARVNLKNPGTYDLVAVNTITHTPGQGTAGDGSTSYFTTGYVVPAGNQDSAYIKAFNRVKGSTAATRGLISGGTAGGRFAELLQASTTGNLTCRLNSSTSTASGVDAGQHVMMVRTASTVTPIYRNGVAQTDPATTSGVPSLFELFVHARNSSGTASLFNPGQLSITGAGAGLTAAEVAMMYFADIETLKILGAV